MTHWKRINNKIVTSILVIGIVSTGFAGITSANSTKLSPAGNNVEQWINKMSHSGNYFGKRKGFEKLSQQEKTALKSMSDTEKKEFFSAKKQEMKAQKEAGKAVIDKLINGEPLTAAEEAIRGEILMKLQDDTGKSRKGSDIIEKILAGDELSADDENQLILMQAKRAERSRA